eukprot:3449734-Rhodomonas_salina.1
MNPSPRSRWVREYVFPLAGPDCRGGRLSSSLSGPGHSESVTAPPASAAARRPARPRHHDAALSYGASLRLYSGSA